MIEIHGRDLDVLLGEDPGAAMIRDPEYRAASHLRTEALVETVLQPTVPLAVAG